MRIPEDAGGKRIKCSKCGTISTIVAAGDGVELVGPTEATAPDPGAPSCASCGKPVAADTKFCTGCGAMIGGAANLDVDDEFRARKAFQREATAGRRARRASADRQSKVNRTSLWILLLAALYATCGTFLGSKASKEADIADRQLQAIQQQYDWDEEIEIPVDGEHYTVAELRLQIQQTVRLIYVIYYVLAGIMLGLFLWARRSPIPAITTALCLWLALIVYQAIFDPSTILKGGGWLVKPLFIGIFVGGLRAAFKQQAARRAVAGAVQHSGVETTRRRRR